MVITSLPSIQLCRDAVPTLPQGRHYPDTRYSILNTLGYSYPNPNPYPYP